MPRVPVHQSNFTRGELDPRLIARFDTDLYRKGARKIRNGLVIPQGGIKRRFGLKYIDSMGALSGYQILIAPFEFSVDVGYLIVFTDLTISIYHDDVWVADVVSPYPASVVADLRYTQSADTMIICHPDYQPRKLVRTSAHAGWNLSTISFRNYPVYDFKRNYDGMAFTPSGTAGLVTLACNFAVFTADYVGGIYSGNQGTMRLSTFIDSTHMSGVVITDFKDTSQIAGTISYLAEPAWGTTRGWPNAVTFYENRLWFGGCKALPQTVFGSQSDDYFDLDPGSGLDSEGISFTINSSKSNKIEYLSGIRNLVIFTSGGEFTSPQADDKPLTPKTISIRPQSKNGTSTVLPQDIDNQLLYVQKGGKKVKNFVFDIQQYSYGSQDVSILSPHLIKNPVDAAVLKNSQTEDAEYYFLVNNDGSLAVFQTVKSQEVQAWTLCLTDGQIMRIASVNSQIYFVIKRVINQADVYYIEKFDANYFTDCAVQQTHLVPTSTITGLSHLEGKEVRVKGDGYVLNNKIVNGGEITLEQTVSQVEVGLNFDVEIVLMPPAIQGMNVNQYDRKRTCKAFVDFYETLGIRVNGVLVPFREFGDNVLDQPAEPQTGFSWQVAQDGWNPRNSITITQTDPLPFTLIGTALDVEFDGGQ